MTKRTFEDIKTILKDVEDEETIDLLSRHLAQKKARIGEEKQRKQQISFFENNGYLVSIEEIEKFRIDPNIICAEIILEVDCTSWDARDHSDAKVSIVCSQNALYKFLKLYDYQLGKLIDADDLHWNDDVKFEKDDFDDPFYTTIEHIIWFYTKKQPAPAISEEISLFDSNEIKDCIIREGIIVEKESGKQVLKLQDWDNEDFFNVRKLIIANPFE